VINKLLLLHFYISHQNDKKDHDINGSSNSSDNGVKVANQMTLKLPKGLEQVQLHVPTEDKDVYIYYYLLKVNSYAVDVYFINSIIISTFIIVIIIRMSLLFSSPLS